MDRQPWRIRCMIGAKMSKKTKQQSANPRQASKKADTRDTILRHLLPNIPFDGWTDEALQRAAKACKISPEKLDQAFPQGVTDAVAYFFHWATARMAEKITPRTLQGLRVRDKVTLCVRTRLELLAGYKEATSSALTYMAKPPRALHMPKMVWETADVIWKLAGDTSADYNKYTKRIILSGVLGATTLYWLNDTSDHNEKTWVFLDKRIDNALSVGKTLSRFKRKEA